MDPCVKFGGLKWTVVGCWLEVEPDDCCGPLFCRMSQSTPMIIKMIHMAKKSPRDPSHSARRLSLFLAVLDYSMSIAEPQRHSRNANQSEISRLAFSPDSRIAC